MFSPGMVEMHGRIVGNMDCARTKIGPTGTVSGDLKSDAVTIHGTVIGGIDANRVDIDSTGVVRGDISHADISVHQHAVFEGRLIRTPQADGGTTA